MSPAELRAAISLSGFWGCGLPAGDVILHATLLVIWL